MKKQFAIKSIKASKNIVISAAKKESANLLNFLADDICCPWDIGQPKSITVKPTFSL